MTLTAQLIATLLLANDKSDRDAATWHLEYARLWREARRLGVVRQVRELVEGVQAHG